MTDEVGAPIADNEVISRIYEAGFWFVPTIAEADIPRETTALKDLLAKAGAAIFAEEMPKERRLAYPMRAQKAKTGTFFTSGSFGWVKFEAAPERIREIEAALKEASQILRFILIQTVRESTLSVPRAPRADSRRERPLAPKDAAASVAVSETELERSLEKIIAE